MKFILITLSYILVVFFPLVAQEKKNEKETSIAFQNMPSGSQEIMKPILEKSQKQKHFQELTNNEKSFESKVIYNGEHYSIEFFEDGTLMDVERLVKFRKLDKDVKRTINNSLGELFLKFKIRKTQIQYSSESLSDAKVIEAIMNENWNALNTRYEIITYGKSHEMSGTFEILLDENGNIENHKEVIRRPMDNILY